MSLLTSEVKSIVGLERTYISPEPFGISSRRYFALAIGDSNPMYAAKEIAPLTLICETNQYANLPMNHDGYAGHFWDIEIPNTRLLRGGNKYCFYKYVHATDVLHVSWKIDEINERVNSKGVAMVTMLSTATYRNQHQELLATNTETLIWVELASRNE